jgi:hypothetical protein
VTAEIGSALSTRWLRGTDGDGSPDAGATVGAGAELRLVPVASIRLHVAYAAQRLDATTVSSLGSTVQRVPAHQWLYDLSVVARPFAASGPAPLRGAWVSAGAGAVTTSFPGDTSSFDTAGPCRADLITSGICFSRQTVQRFQVTGAIGADLVPLGRTIGLYGNVEAHVFRPPVDAGFYFAPPPELPASRGSSSRAALAATVTRQGSTVSGTAATARLTLGLRLTPGHHSAAAAPPPSPPPSSPTVGGTVVVSTREPGADVYLVPFNRWKAGAVLCRLRPVTAPGSYYRGSTASAAPVNALISRPVTHYLVVIQGGRYYLAPVQVADNSVDRRQLDMARDGRPTGCR